MAATVLKQTRHLFGLNPEQRIAVSRTEGPVLILAGAGTGKTKTIVHRIAHLIEGVGVPAHHIAALTFTNRAADEMRERVASYVGEAARQVTLSTFHSLGVRIIRDQHARLGLPKRFAVYGTADQLAALKTAASEIHIDNDQFDLKRILWQISDWKTKQLSPDDARGWVIDGPQIGTRKDDYAILAADAYPKYEEILRASGAVDYDDLLLLPVRLLEADEEVRRAVWRRWHYIMIDEYQDTNGVQLDLARLLAGTRRNLCVVGDDDQSIYAFRGADVGNILRFEEHFPGAQVVRLEQNYRSTRRILAAANAVIAGNRTRHQKQLRTENAVGAPLEWIEYESEAAEADGVAREIGLRKYSAKQAWGQYAVLYRANTQARPLEEAFRARNIPYRVVGGTSFFDRKEVADAIAYLRVIANPDDEIALRRIINYPARGIGRTTILKVAEVARQQKTTFRRALEPCGVKAVRDFLEFLALARHRLEVAEAQAALLEPRPEQATPIAGWAKEFIEQTGIEAEIRSDPRNAKSAQARADNLRDVVGTLVRYERRVWDERLGRAPAQINEPGEWEPPTLSGALAWLALDELNDEDDSERDDDSRVALMTLHSAKGLEFNDVFIIGLEDGLLPHARSIELDDYQADPLDEERRLFYVGITRARQRLTLTSCRSRKRAGGVVACLPSRYLKEIPETLLEKKGSETALSAEDSAELRKNFFSQMKTLLAE